VSSSGLGIIEKSRMNE